MRHSHSVLSVKPHALDHADDNRTPRRSPARPPPHAPPGATIIYVTLQATAEDLAKKLDRTGLAARAYHAGMEDDDRSRVQDWFMASSHGIIVATIAFGMGVDKRDIRYIYHFNPPKSLENYSQEIGRAGRDGEPSTCELLYCADDLNVLKNFVFGDTPTRDAVRSLVHEVHSLGDQFDVSTYELSNLHDIRLLVVRTLLTYLELTGYLEGGTPFYSTYQFKPLQSSTEILARFQGERRDFLAKVFQQTAKARTWFKIDVDAAAGRINTERDRIIRALDYLAEQGLLELKAEGVRLRYRRLKAPPDLDALADKLYDRAVAREQSELARLDDVVSLVMHHGCQVSRLGAHFGEPLADPCGHCSSCQRTMSHMAKTSPVPAKSSDVAGPELSAPIDASVWRRVDQLQATHADALSSPESVASPALWRDLPLAKPCQTDPRPVVRRPGPRTIRRRPRRGRETRWPDRSGHFLALIAG